MILFVEIFLTKSWVFAVEAVYCSPLSGLWLIYPAPLEIETTFKTWS
jgi:hypothetical protein